MPKTKTNRAAAKRFKRLGSGKIKRGAAFRRHLLTSKTRTRKRNLRGSQYIHASDVKQIIKLLPNG